MKIVKMIKIINAQASTLRSVGKDDMATGLEIARGIIESVAKEKITQSAETKAKRAANANHARAIRLARIAERRAAAGES